MQSIELEFRMQQLFISALSGIWVLCKSVALLLDEVSALLRKL